MDHINVLIIDDEVAAREMLKAKLTTYCTGINILGTANSAQEAFEIILKDNPDLIFLDIAMPRESGFDLLKRLPHLNFEIIFVTGFDSYAIDAIDFCAIGYVLKPIQNDDLIKAVENARQRIVQKKENERNKVLLNNILNPGKRNNKIGIPTMEGLEFVEAGNIIRCEGLQKCTRIVTRDEKDIISSYNIGEFIRLLEPYGFFATHKSHLINLTTIKKYNKEGTVVLDDGSAVPVSKRRKADFLKLLVRL